jgi:hypothetical protein
MASLSYLSSRKLIELLMAADPPQTMNVRVLSSTRLALGVDPSRPTTVIDLAREKIEAVAPELVPSPQKIAPTPELPPVREPMSPAWRSPRRSGDYWYEIKGRRVECRSLKEVLSGGLLALEHTTPVTLD